MWWPARVEVRSALERLRRGGDLSPAAYQASLDRLAAMIESWGEIEPTDAVRERASTLLERSALRAADALHLAAAMEWCNGKTRNRIFVTHDLRLAEAAKAAGFNVPTIS